VALRYLPAGRTDIGGDFYDVTPLDDGRLAAFVGDVMGRGVTAASAMAQMRSALRTLVALDPDPAAVMAGLDRLFDRYELEQLVTVAYALLDPAHGTVQLVSAGHPAPLLVRADGTVEHIDNDETLILGVGGGRRSIATAQLRPEDTLLMFTDGLVERRDESIDDGRHRLVSNSELMRGPDLQRGLHRLVDLVRDQTRDDDVAALALRLQAVAVDTVA
jgi:serine phosphatase RsbU (regulator of sigma subunit)